MWDETLIESKGTGKRGKGWLTFPIALLIHVLVIGVLIGTSYWSVEAVQARPPMPIIFVGPKSVPDGGSLSTIPKQRSNSGSKTSSKIPPFVQPPAIPENSAEPQNAIQETEMGKGSSNNVVTSPFDGPPGPPCEFPCVPGSGTGNRIGTGFDEPRFITPEVTQPVLILKIKPDYPLIALHVHIQGIVYLQAVITQTGTVDELRVLHSPHPLLEKAAVNAVKQWLYRPAMVNGRPVKVYFNVTVEFKIQ